MQHRNIILLGLVVLLLSGCINQQSTNINLTDEQKRKIENLVSDILSFTNQIPKNQINTKVIGYWVDSDILFVNLTVSIGDQSLNITTQFSKDLKYILLGVRTLDDIQKELSVPRAPPQTPSNLLSVPDLSNVPFKGSPDADIIMIEFSDFECPFCKRFADNTMPQLKSEWIDTGKLRFYYIHFPLGFHQKAEPSARASYCAQKQGKFWEYHDIIFSRISTIQNNIDGYATLAREIGLDEAEFRRCYESKEAIDKVQSDISVSMMQGVQGTPSFLLVIPKSITNKDIVTNAATIVNGEVRENDEFYGIFFSGAYPYQQFNQMLRKILS
ncbi:MAG: DsbA family protein [Candidatus Micrarchaeota archaeon]|nr:DsbA family protein [Candidatus Micrarchaeota archaeon]MCX8154354.1 DsbA family protein [Candidatus Micrarchaeota archaeon]